MNALHDGSGFILGRVASVTQSVLHKLITHILGGSDLISQESRPCRVQVQVDGLKVGLGSSELGAGSDNLLGGREKEEQIHFLRGNFLASDYVPVWLMEALSAF